MLLIHFLFYGELSIFRWYFSGKSNAISINPNKQHRRSNIKIHVACALNIYINSQIINNKKNCEEELIFFIMVDIKKRCLYNVNSFL